MWNEKVKKYISLHPPLSTSAPFSLQVSHHILLLFQMKHLSPCSFLKEISFQIKHIPSKFQGASLFMHFILSLSHSHIFQLCNSHHEKYPSEKLNPFLNMSLNQTRLHPSTQKDWKTNTAFFNDFALEMLFFFFRWHMYLFLFHASSLSMYETKKFLIQA